jgi:hypothetical protein
MKCLINAGFLSVPLLLLSRIEPALANGGSIFVSSYGNSSILQYDAATGAFIGTFVASGYGGLSHPDGILFGKDGNLYVANSDGGPPEVLRYDGHTGAFLGIFVPSGSGGALGFTDMVWGPRAICLSAIPPVRMSRNMTA